MGTKLGPSVACLTMGHFEEQMFSRFNGTQLILYKRYIDDVVGVAVGPRNDLERLINFAETSCPLFKFTHCISNTTFLNSVFRHGTIHLRP